MKKIWITGMPGTGSTLFSRMFSAYGLDVQPDETQLHQFLANDYSVGRRKANGFLSGRCPTAPMELQLLLNNDVIVFICTRTVKHSPEMAMEYYTYLQDLSIAKLSGKSFHLVKYNDLIHRPRAVQHDVERIIGMTTDWRWNQYPEFVPEELDLPGKHQLRPLGMDWKRMHSDGSVCLASFCEKDHPNAV